MTEKIAKESKDLIEVEEEDMKVTLAEVFK